MLESQLEAIMARRRLSHGSTQSSGSTAEPGESEMSSFRRIWSIAGSLVLVALIVLGLYNLLRWIFPKSFTPTPQQIIFAGRITNQGTGEWPNDRLVLLFVTIHPPLKMNVEDVLCPIFGFASSMKLCYDNDNATD